MKYNVNIIMKRLESLGTEQIKRIYINHGAKEPLYGVKTSDLQSIVKEIRKKVPKARMIIVGDGPDVNDLVMLAHKNKLDNHVTFTGKVPWSEVPKYYQLADVFVTASKTETQGLTVIEAMAAEKPVVAIKDESFELVMIDKQDGLFFETDKEYQDLIIKLYKDKAFGKMIAKQARITANAYNPEVYAKRVLEVYESVINKDTNVLRKVIHNVKKVFLKNGDSK